MKKLTILATLLSSITLAQKVIIDYNYTDTPIPHTGYSIAKEDPKYAPSNPTILNTADTDGDEYATIEKELLIPNIKFANRYYVSKYPNYEIKTFVDKEDITRKAIIPIQNILPKRDDFKLTHNEYDINGYIKMYGYDKNKLSLDLRDNDVHENNLKGFISTSDTGDDVTLLNTKNIKYINNVSEIPYNELEDIKYQLVIKDVNTKINNNDRLYIRANGNEANTINEDATLINFLDNQMQDVVKQHMLYAVNGSTPLYALRSVGVAAPKEAYNMSTSEDAPNITAALNIIREKFPNITISQAKEILLSTATPNGKKNYSELVYLDNEFGWGRYNLDYALNGPGRLNYGLIVGNNKYYVGMPHKILDERDPSLAYMYINVPTNDTYVFSNTILGQLSGDKDSTEYMKYGIAEAQGYFRNMLKREKTLPTTDFFIPKVFKSEEKFYGEGFYKAGFRKAGKGTLELAGEQGYSEGINQVLEGTLVYKNNQLSNIRTEVFENGTLVIDGNNISLGRIHVSGTLIIKGKNITLETLSVANGGKIYGNINQLKINNLITVDNNNPYKLKAKKIDNVTKEYYDSILTDVRINPRLQLHLDKPKVKIEDYPYKEDLIFYNRETKKLVNYYNRSEVLKEFKPFIADDLEWTQD